MTRKDYQIIATALAQSFCEAGNLHNGAYKGVEICAEHISHALQVENPRFSPKTFEKYITKICDDMVDEMLD